jgi:hypothetical protein
VISGKSDKNRLPEALKKRSNSDKTAFIQVSQICIHGAAMDEYWKQEFGYGIDQLTQGEAGHLKNAQSVDAIRDRIAAARDKAGHQVGAGAATHPQSPESQKTGLKNQSQAEGLANDQASLAESAEIEKRYDAVFQNYLEAKARRQPW